MKPIQVGLAIVTFTLASCSDATVARVKGYGGQHEVELFSGGKLVKQWTSTGKPESSKHSDGYFFKDLKTGKLVEVSGEVVITQL